MRKRPSLAVRLCVAAVAFAGVLAAACGASTQGDSAGGPPKLSSADAQARLEAIALQPADVGAGFTRDAANFQTNEQLAKARPDTDQARKQYADWQQILQLNVQIAAPVSSDLVFTAKIARVINTATIFQTPEGADAALGFIRDLPASVVANFLLTDAGDTTVTDTQVVKDIDFPAAGDASYAWRVTGKATFTNGFTVILVADTIFVRTGRVNANITAVALGEAPSKDQVSALVETFVRRARSAAPHSGAAP